MTPLEYKMHMASVHTLRGRDGAWPWRSLLAILGGAFGFALLAAPCYAQAVTTAGAEAALSGVRSAELGGATEHNGTAIRPFHINVPEEALVDLRRGLVATRWPERETVTDQSQGVQLAKIQPLIQYWGTDYDWRRAEAKLNALPQFVTTIDGVDIQFVHVKSRHPNAMPLIMTHGWPGSIFELLKVVHPLTDPTAYGGRSEDAFHLVMPTLPGYGFSGNWQSERQYVQLQRGTGKIVLPFTGGKVNLVMQPGRSGSAAVNVLLDGKPVGNAHGADGADGVARFDQSGMLRLIAGASRRRHVLTLVTSGSRRAGVRLYFRTLVGPEEPNRGRLCRPLTRR
jgi:hypothetical protein